MCDEKPLVASLFASVSVVTGAAVAVGAAMVLNGSVLGAVGSPALMLTAAGLCAAAVFVIFLARDKAREYVACRIKVSGSITISGANFKCAGSYESVMNSLTALAAAAAAEVPPCLAAAAIAWIPWAAQPAIWIILTAMAAQLVSVINLLLFYMKLRDCLNQNYPER